MTRGKLLFMFAGLCVVAILVWIAVLLQTPSPRPMGAMPTTQSAASSAATQGDFYVAGHVFHPGMYTLQVSETLRGAITAAGGANAPASDLIVRVMRKEQGVTKTQSIPLPRVLSGEQDQPISRGDVIDIVQQARPTTVEVEPAVEPLHRDDGSQE